MTQQLNSGIRNMSLEELTTFLCFHDGEFERFLGSKFEEIKTLLDDVAYAIDEHKDNLNKLESSIDDLYKHNKI